MANLLLLFATLSVFSKNLLEQMKKNKAENAETSIPGGPPPPPPPPPVVIPSTPSTTQPQKKEPSKPSVPQSVKPLTAAQIKQQKKRVEFVNETLSEHEKTIEDLRQELIDTDRSAIFQIEKAATMLLRKYTDFADIRDFDFDNKNEVISQLDSAITETKKLIEDITSSKNAPKAPETITPGSIPLPPPPPPAQQTRPTGVLKPKSPLESVKPAPPGKKEPARPQQPAKPTAPSLNPADITGKKLKPTQNPTKETLWGSDLALKQFTDTFNNLETTFPDAEVRNGKAKKLLGFLEDSIKKSAGDDKDKKQELYNAVATQYK